MASTKGVDVGPWGGIGEKFKFPLDDDIGKGQISKIIVKSNNGPIISIKFEYKLQPSGVIVPSPVYGGEGGVPKEMTIELDDAILEIGGTFGPLGERTVINSLYFKTTKGKEMHCGSESGKNFSLPVNPDTAWFAGYSGKYVDNLSAIGAILLPK